MSGVFHVIVAVGLFALAFVFGCAPESGKSPHAATSPNTQRSSNQTVMTKEEARKEAVKNHDGPMDDFFESNQNVQVPEAREWIKRNPKTFRAGGNLEVMLSELYDAGAKRIIVLTNMHFCDYFIVVVLPSDMALREKVFATDARFGALSGTGTEEDFGQKYLGHKLNDSMFTPAK